MNTLTKRTPLPLAWILVLSIGFPLSGSCCEPILPLFQLLTGASLAGLAGLTQSLVWLLIAIAIKCGAFVFLERRLTWKHAVLFMILANVVSTIPGVVIAALASSGTEVGLFLSLPLVFGLGWMVQRRVAGLSPAARPFRISGGAAMAFFLVVVVASTILFVVAESALYGNSYASYWVLKFIFVAAAAFTGIVISAVLEECVVGQLSLKSVGNISFYPSVFRANYITLGAVLLVAAIKILPQRLQSPHFITSWLDAILSAVGPA
jgi:hypothetical protein